MKVKLLLLMTVLLLAACSSSDPYTKRAELERARQEKKVEVALDNMPKWMSAVPTSNSAIYESGTATSADLSMADLKAKSDAYGKICMLIGGTATQRTKIYRRDTEAASLESSEMALRTGCREVDLTGIEVHETKRVREGTRFRTYVLVALPIGDANLLAKLKQEQLEREGLAVNATKAFKEMDSQ